MQLPDLVTRTIASHPHPLLFATISGAHLYGFASPDSDYDIRGVHVLPSREVLGLIRGNDTITTMLDGPPEIDLVTHDVEKFLRLLLRRNG
jgi:predicted nucleotidyltransferase